VAQFTISKGLVFLATYSIKKALVKRGLSMVIPAQQGEKSEQGESILGYRLH
jgi:hypothetical protein